MKNSKFLSIVLSVVLSVLSVALLTQAATSISTSITTGGTLAVTGASTLTGAVAANGGLTVDSTAFIVADTTGNTTIAGTLGVTGLTTMVNATTTGNSSIAGALWVNGNATTTSAGAISTQSSLTVGAGGTALNGLYTGFCSMTALTVTASSTAYADCNTSITLPAGSKVWVTATGSLPTNFVIEAASSSVASKINLRFLNTGMITGEAVGAHSFNFFGIN
ncbi:MAG: hypothetical protein Q7S81_02810 [bacterium]|nr:hypothetical protein [bacterium]